jgi:lipopolysaccharide/colanic/teichoic acid biosynthesis glycosyltransferase
MEQSMASLETVGPQAIPPNVLEMDLGLLDAPSICPPALELAPAEQTRVAADRVATALHAGTKRAFDIAIALVVLLVLAPVLAAVALLVVLESPGPVFYRAERIGYRGRPLRMLKFRKMYDGASGPALTLAGDRRLTRVGAVLARTRLDEAPQLWHILRGEMSLVGPRPEDPRFVACHPDEFSRILAVRPGLAGWSQLAFADEGRLLSREDPHAHYVRAILPQKVALDVMYAERVSLRRDLKILAAISVAVGLRVPIAVNPATGALTLRRRR